MEPVDEFHEISLTLQVWLTKEFDDLKAEVAKWELPDYVV